MQREIISEIVIEILLKRVMNGHCYTYIVVDLKYALDYQIFNFIILSFESIL